MTTAEPNATDQQERIGRELLTQRPLFLGIDGDGAAHYWDGYERAVAVVPADATENADAATYELAQTPLDRLDQWCEHVRDSRGWEIGPHVGDSLVEMLVAGMQSNTGFSE